ncbi:Probable zinc protease pqqL [hydrothermal vent metagenome]|uniref:Probable zinc protease pqqL n=1 Tax=hydrothermal vent metagenome TaxID=652676 RepID=A0A1W1BNI9_9ZZZZ
MKKILVVLLLCILITLNAKDLPTEKSLIEGTLQNGFKYTIKKNAKPKSRAEFRLLVKVGSVDEDNDQKGIAHFTEHMAFNGSKHFKKNELIKYLESIGVRFGNDLNANTGYENTLYKLTVPLEKDNLKKSFLVFEDWASGLNFNPNEFDKERGVILEEARSRDTVGLRLYNKSKYMVLGDSKFMDRLPIGDKEIIKNISVNRAKDFYDKWYRPEFMHFVAVGDFNITKIEGLIKEHFSTLKNSNSEKRVSREIPDMNYTQVLSITDKEVTSNSLSVQYIDEIIYTRTEDDMRRGIIESMVYNLFNMKAEEQLLKDNPKATTIRFTSGQINSHKGGYKFSVSYRGDNELSALKELYEMIFSFQKYGFSENSLNLVKKHKLALNEKEYKRISDIRSSSVASSLVKCASNDYPFVDYDYKYRFKKELISDIKLDEVNAKYREILAIANRVILFINTTGNNVSKEDALKTIDKAKETLTDYSKAEKLPEKLLNKELKERKILSKKYDKKTGVYKFVLENGIEVIFKQTDFSKNKVKLQGFSFGGDSLYDVKDLDSAIKATGFVSKSGAGEFSSIDIAKILAGKDVSASIGISELNENVYGSANVEDIDTMFELMYLKLTKPKIDKTIAKNRKKYLKYVAQEEDKNPKTKFSKEFFRYFYKNNPRIIYDTNETINRLNSDDMLKIFKDRFSDMNNFHFAIIGDIEVKKIEKLIAKYLGNLPTKEREESFVDRKKEYLEGNQKFIKDYNNENISNVAILFKSRLAYTKKRELALDAMTSILKVRLRELIREEKSGVYGIGVSTEISRLEKNRSTAKIRFSCDPKRRAELISAVYGVIETLKKDSVTNKELDVYKKKFHKSYETAMRENYYWLSYMVDSYRYGTPIEDILKLPKMVDNVSKDDVKKIANEIFVKDVLQAELNPKKEDKK